MTNDDPRLAAYAAREQSTIGRMVNRIDNMLVVAGAALTFSRDQIRKVQESNRMMKREVAVPMKSATPLPIVRVQEKPRQPAACRSTYVVARNADARVDTGKPKPSHAADMER
jgi:hypothetical protein